MKLTASIGCSNCGFTQDLNITLPFNCEDIPCPKCREYAMSITAMQDLPKPVHKPDTMNQLMQGLYRIRQL